jgi:N6-L-threonylcarbamoyladenine synthase
MLLQKLKKAAKQTGIREIAIAGGVAANSGLRQALENQRTELGWEVYIPKFEYCTDNAAMIAMTAHFKFLENDFSSMDVAPMPRMKF